MHYRRDRKRITDMGAGARQEKVDKEKNGKLEGILAWPYRVVQFLQSGDGEKTVHAYSILDE